MTALASLGMVAGRGSRAAVRTQSGTESAPGSVAAETRIRITPRAAGLIALGRLRGLKNDLTVVIRFHRVEESSNGHVIRDWEQHSTDNQAPLNRYDVSILIGGHGILEAGARLGIFRCWKRLNFERVGKMQRKTVFLGGRIMKINGVGALLGLKRRRVIGFEHGEANESPVPRGRGESWDAQRALEAQRIVEFVPSSYVDILESGAGREPAFHFIGDRFFPAGFVLFALTFALGAGPLAGVNDFELAFEGAVVQEVDVNVALADRAGGLRYRDIYLDAALFIEAQALRGSLIPGKRGIGVIL